MSPRYSRRKSRASHTAGRADVRHDAPMCRRVLIVDDNSAFRGAARQLLERGGFDVMAEAGDGAEGLRAAKEHTPDLAIVDVQLPDLDGFEVAERLRALEPAPHVILISSLDGTDFGTLVAGSSALGFVPKAELSARAIEALLALTR
jgi:CheY-like chemotaxis protein